MKCNIEIIDKSIEEKVDFKVHEVTDEINYCINLLNENNQISGIKDNEQFIIEEKNIYYIESVDNKTFIYIKNDSFESKLRLYELEERLSTIFFRCSKSMILNTKKIKSVKASLNGRFTATLLNNEEIVISRSYVKDLKAILGL